MSKYADLRWKIADLEKALEKERNFSERLVEEMQKQEWKLRARDNEIKELKALLHSISETMGDNNG